MHRESFYYGDNANLVKHFPTWRTMGEEESLRDNNGFRYSSPPHAGDAIFRLAAARDYAYYETIRARIKRDAIVTCFMPTLMLRPLGKILQRRKVPATRLQNDALNNLSPRSCVGERGEPGPQTRV